jgi:hypothetical protein
MAAHAGFLRGDFREAEVNRLLRAGEGAGMAVALFTFATTSGCMAYKVVSAPVKVAATTVIVTSETAGAAVTATGKIAVSAFGAAGRVGSGSLDAASRLSETGMVTFVDVGQGTIVRVPWRQGFTLATAGAEARMQLARRAIDVVRAGSVIYSASRLADEGAQLASGDVVRVRG